MLICCKDALIFWNEQNLRLSHINIIIVLKYFVMKPYRLLLIALLCSVSANAQQYLDTPTVMTAVSNSQAKYVRHVEAMWNKILFYAGTQSVNGEEWWTFDGNNTVTPAPEVNPGNGNGVIRINAPGSIYTTFYTIQGSKVYFRGNNPATGMELYEWDGTSTGMKMAADLIPGTTGSNPHNFYAVDKYVFFVADSTNSAYQNLYQYDTSSKSIATIIKDVGDKPVRMINEGKSLYMFFDAKPALSYNTQNKMMATLNIPDDTLADNFVKYGSTIYFITGKDFHIANISDNRLNMIQNGVYAPVPNMDSVHTQQRSYRQFFDTHILPYDGKIYFWRFTDTSTKYGDMYYYDTLTKTSAKAPGLKPISLEGSKMDLVYNNKMYYRDVFSLVRYDGTKADTFLPLYFYNFEATILNNHMYLAGRVTISDPTNHIYRITDTAMSVQDVSFNAEAALYPNPAGNEAHLSLNLHTAQNISLQLIDMTGKTVYRTKHTLYGKGQNNIHIPLHDVPAGNYFVTLRGRQNELLWSGKLLRQ